MATYAFLARWAGPVLGLLIGGLSASHTLGSETEGTEAREVTVAPSEPSRSERFTVSPLDTSKQLAESELTRSEKFKLGADYQIVGQIASDCIGDGCEDYGVGGIARLFGSATFMRDTSHPGSLVVRVESRDKVGTDIPPEDLGLASLGYIGFTAIDYSDIGLGVPELYWRQQFLGETPVEIRVGRMAPVAFFDVTPFSDNLTGFMNLSMIFSPTVTYALPGAFGAVGYVGITESFYVLGTIMDANGEWDGSGDLGNGEWWTGFEFGWTKQSTGGFYLLDNFHISYWHQDETDVLESGEGVSMALSRWFADGKYGAFFRAGWADEGRNESSAFLEKSVAAGLTTHVGKRDDYTGIAVSWGRPFRPDRDQWSSEFFYRFQLTKKFALTPSLQLLIDPALNPEEDTIWLAALRARYAF